jgi:phosphatidylglycerophosphate synthase
MKSSLSHVYNIPNAICMLRVFIAIYACLNYYRTENHLTFTILVVLSILLDGLDGYAARKLNQCTDFGAKFDVYCDRFTEYLLFGFFWLVMGHPWWFFTFFLLRGLVIDTLNQHNLTPLGNSFLRSSRFMRFLYGALKIVCFILLAWQPIIVSIGTFSHSLAYLVVYLTILIATLRSLPVIFKF